MLGHGFRVHIEVRGSEDLSVNLLLQIVIASA
jgi:hypothetical protein